MAAVGVDGVYVHLPVAPTSEAFATFMAEATRLEENFHGFSVTIPHKEHAARWLRATFGNDALSPLAQRCGAVNTLGRADAGWWGDNTDAGGIKTALQQASGESGRSLAGRSALVLGAGGVARAALAALGDLGCKLTVCNRTHERALGLARDFGAEVTAWEKRLETGADLILNCTSIGMAPQADESPLETAHWRGDEIVFDTIYTPPQTRLLREAARAGCRTISGLDLFAAQAALQFGRWHGRDFPVEVVREFRQPAAPPAM